MKFYNLLLSIVLVALSVVGCSTPTDQKRVEIRWITAPISSVELENFINEEVIKKFEESHPGVKIKWIKLKESKNQIKQQLAAGAGPDIISATPSDFKEFVKAGYLLDLEPYAQKYRWREKYYDWAYELFEYDGKLMGAPSLVEGLLVYYNKDMFKKNNWAIPKTYDDLKRLSSEMQKKGVIPFAFGSSDYKAANEWWLSAAINASFTQDELKPYLLAEKPWNSPEMAEAVGKLQYLWQQGYINDKKSHSISIDSSWNLFYSQKAAMKMEGTWGIKNLLENKPSFEWGVFLIPSFADGVEPTMPVGISSGIGINAKSKHPDEAADFIDFLHSDEVVQKQLQFGDYYPVKGLDVKSAKDTDPKIVEAYELIQNAFSKNSAGYLSWTYWPPNVNTHLWEEFDSLVLGKITVKEYLNEAQKIAEKDKKEGMLILSE